MTFGGGPVMRGGSSVWETALSVEWTSGGLANGAETSVALRQPGKIGGELESAVVRSLDCACRTASGCGVGKISATVGGESWCCRECTSRTSEREMNSVDGSS